MLTLSVYTCIDSKHNTNKTTKTAQPTTTKLNTKQTTQTNLQKQNNTKQIN